MSDILAKRVYLSLIKDFQAFEGTNFLARERDAFLQGIKSYRSHEFPAVGEISPFRFKAYRQISHIFKRYRFDDDMYTDAELTKNGIEKYLGNQVRLATPRQLRSTSILVLSEARRLCREILSSIPYEPAVFRKIGRRAEVGCKLSDAFIDHKMTTRFTCPSTLQPRDFESPDDFTSSRYIEGVVIELIKSSTHRCDYLKLTSVPKNWKTFRWITPLSTAGLYWSYGIKGYVEECLRSHGLDLSKLEGIHKKLARKFSISRSHVTADLSAASDSLTSEILNRVLPRFLYNDVKKTFVRNIRHDEREFYTCSVLPMGNAATFPIETLVFYCLIRAIGNLLRVKGTYSVYGDDLIYPRRIHKYVLHVFGDMGLLMNEDKTCVHSHFRESCGGDYYHGVDVRPFLFPEGKMSGGRLKKLQYLYKVLNTLLVRWSRYEIRYTYQMLISEIAYLGGDVYYIPPSYPDTAGLKCDVPPRDALLPYQGHTLFEHGTVVYKFPCILQFKPDTRPIVNEQLYVCDTLDRMDEESWIQSNRYKVPWRRPPKLRLSGSNYQLIRLKKSYWNAKTSKVVGYHKYVLTEPLHAEGCARKSYGAISSWT